MVAGIVAAVALTDRRPQAQAASTPRLGRNLLSSGLPELRRGGGGGYVAGDVRRRHTT